tara:strand:- start:893 stop:1285 length:393 start_codon:yes stop_codon:yes gene_type:complete
MIKNYEKIDLISDYLKTKINDIDKSNSAKEEILLNSRRLTNIGTFREYIKSYLRNNVNVSDNMTFLVRQLPPSEFGLPIEIYVFSNDNEWINYENIQADIFDHLIAATFYFDLHIFQNPSGNDFKKLFNN